MTQMKETRGPQTALDPLAYTTYRYRSIVIDPFLIEKNPNPPHTVGYCSIQITPQ